MSNQYVRFTGYMTLRPDKMGLWRMTALRFGKRVAKSVVGPLPTDWPYRIMSSSFAPYISTRHLYAASISAYVFCSLGCQKNSTFFKSLPFQQNIKLPWDYLHILAQKTLKNNRMV